MQKPRRGVRAEGTQALLSLERLRVRKVHPDSGEAARDGRAGGTEEAAGAGGERGPGASAHVPRLGDGWGNRDPSGVTPGPRGASGYRQHTDSSQF